MTMTVTITCELTVGRDGTVTIRHTCPDAPSEQQRDAFGFPGRELTAKEAQDVCRNLPGWVVSRFKVEADAAVRRISHPGPGANHDQNPKDF